MSYETVRVRGYAAPFARWQAVDDGYECFAPQAFRLSNSSPIDIRFEHGGQPFASTASSTLTLFQDDFGLGYEAVLPPQNALWGLLPAMWRGQIGASVNMPNLRRDQVDAFAVKGVAHHTIREAQIDHIAICGNPTFTDTSAWLSTWDDDGLQPHLRAAARRWSAGYKTSALISGLRHERRQGPSAIQDRRLLR